HRSEHGRTQLSPVVLPRLARRRWFILSVQCQRLSAQEVVEHLRLGPGSVVGLHREYPRSFYCIRRSRTRAISACSTSGGTNLSSGPPNVAMCRRRLPLTCE